jgi:PAS domain S-box-containing protein
MKTRTPELASVGGGAVSFTSDAFLSMVLDRTTDGVLMADGDGVIVYVNVPLLDLFGYDVEDLVGQRVEVLMPEYLRDHHRHHVQEFLAAPEPRPMGREDLDIEGRRSDGSIFSIDVQLNALPGTSLVVATIRDMTPQRQAAVDCAIAKIDLANARSDVDRLQGALDLVIQRLFALGTSIAASASNETLLAERLAAALLGIDEVIEAVQDGRQGVGP